MDDREKPPLRQADIDKVAAMTHPARRRILDLLTVNGPATVGSLAKQADERIGSVSHHLKMLSRAGLVEEAPEHAKDRRESWWRIVKATWSWSITDFAQEAAGEVVAEAAEQAQLRSSVEKAQAWYASREEYAPAWVDAAFTSTSWLNLTADELTELSHQLGDVVREFAAASPERTEPSPSTSGEGRESVYLFTYAVPAKP